MRNYKVQYRTEEVVDGKSRTVVSREFDIDDHGTNSQFTLSAKAFRRAPPAFQNAKGLIFNEERPVGYKPVILPKQV